MAASNKGFRFEFLGIFAICAMVLATALYMEYGMGLEPCMLCMGQRFAFVGIAFFALLGALHNPSLGGHKNYGRLCGLIALGGIALAIRQLYLQSLPEDQVPLCGPSFDYMVEAFPLTDVIVSMLVGSGSCAEVQFTFIGISIPGWSLIAFSGLFIYSVYLGFRQTKLLLLRK